MLARVYSELALPHRGGCVVTQSHETQPLSPPRRYGDTQANQLP